MLKRNDRLSTTRTLYFEPSINVRAFARPQTLYCDCITCDGGYTPIPNADKVPCDDNKCEESQCCELLCSCYMCPDDYSSVKGYDSIVCKDSGCTKDLCCEKDCEERERRLPLRKLTVRTVCFVCSVCNSLCNSLWVGRCRHRLLAYK